MKGEHIPKCPICNQSDEVVEIIYGMPTPEAFKESEEGKYKLGGCVIIDGESPQWYCKRDDLEFGEISST